MRTGSNIYDSQELFQLIATATNDGIWDWDVQHHTIWVNDNFCKTFGYDPRLVPDFYEEWLIRLHPEDKETFLSSILQAQHNGERQWSGTFRFLLAQGIYGTIYQRVYFIRNKTLEVERIVGFVLNIMHLKEEEHILRISEEMFSKTFRSSPVPIAILRQRDGKFADTNDAFLQMLLYRREAFLNKCMTDLFLNGQETGSVAETILQGGEVNNLEVPLLAADGQLRIVLLSTVSMKVEEEHYLIATFQDITDRKRAEEQLRENERHLQLIYDTTTDIIFLLEVKEDRYTFISVNHAFSKATGLPLEQVLAKEVRTVVPEPSLSLVLDHYRRAIALRTTVYWEEVTRYPAGEKTGIVNVTPVFNDTGDCIRLVGSVRDITEEKKAQELMLKEKYLAESIIQSLPGIFCLFTQKGQLIRWNHNLEVVTGYSASEIQNMQPFDFFVPSEHTLIQEKMAEVLTLGKAEMEAQLMTRQGNVLPFYLSGHSFMMENTPCIIGSAIDISEQKRAEAALQDSFNQIRMLASHLENIREEERTALSREIHDELGQLLTALKMELSWLKKISKLSLSEVEERVNMVTQLLNQCIHSVRNISAAIRPSFLDDLGLVEALKWQTREFQKTYGIEASFHHPPDELTLSKDICVAFFRVYQEALTNVARHAQATSVQAQLEMQDSLLVLTVRDNGVGYDSSSPSSQRALGLLGMKERMASVKGSFTITSQPRQGTLVRVEVPL